MRITQRKTLIAAGIATIALLSLSACSSGSGSAGKDSSSSSSSSGASKPMDSASSQPMSSSPSASADPASDLVGPGCSAYAQKVPSGAGSIVGMAQDPVAVAASNNPLLTTLVAAVSGKLNPKVDLVSTLDGGQFTVFAPVDDAFKKIPASTISGLKTDSATLTKILTYHVVPGQISPDAIDGTHKTVEGATLEVTGSGDDLKVNGASAVICGGVHTANATVYLIDTVLMPPAQ